MRTIYFYVLMTLLTLGVFAQTNKKYVISQKVEKEYDKLSLKPYTSLRLVKSDKDVLEISLRDTSVDISGICTLKNGVLTLDYKSENPDETNLTLYSSMEFKHIHVSSFAKLYADTIQMRKKRSWIQIDDYGLIEADSVIAGRVSTIYGGDHAVENCKGIDSVTNFSSKEESKHKLSLSYGFSYRSTLIDNSIYNSPYNSTKGFGFGIGIFYSYDFNPNYLMSIGLEYRYIYNDLRNPVEYSNGDFALLDDTPQGYRSGLHTHYLMLPVKFKYNLFQTMFFSLGIAPGYNVGSVLKSKYITTNNDWSISKIDVDNVNPWRLELLLGFKFFLGFELYYNLLPTYKIGTKGDGLREFGIRIGF